ncbi:MAG TPA: hypothetical protein PLX50_03525 [Candidatus Aminicenantes bacterium]|nr:hypothetical protein [Candidatus Aminicenantes bacterium]
MNRRYFAVATALFFFIAGFLCLPLRAEKIGFRLSLATRSLGDNDVNTWLNSYNELWTDWKDKKGGSLSGRFEPLAFGPGLEAELRINIYRGLAFNIGAGSIQSRKEGQILYLGAGSGQKETHVLSNEVRAVPLKLGLSYSQPVYGGLSLFVTAGRHVTFIKYKVQENYEASISSLGQEFVYWFKKNNDYKSEALGFYASLGAEYSPVRFLGFVVEAEHVWSRADGFKGPYSYSNHLGISENGKASLYFYESDEWGLGQYYPTLQGQEERPDASIVKNPRQGEFDFGGLSLKVGLRVKF